MKKVKKEVKKKTSKKVEKEEMSVDDAFADDDDVEYAPSKPRKEKKVSKENMEDELDDAEEEEVEISKAINGSDSDSVEREITFKTSKPVSKIKKGDRIKIDGTEYMVDSHDIMIDHGSTKEMSIDIFDPAKDKDFQLRYFDDQVESTLDLYELREIMYFKKPFKKIEW